jgi:hypothetical protein
VELENIIPFKLAPKKFLDVNLTKFVQLLYEENYSTTLKGIKHSISEEIPHVDAQ